MGVNLKTHLIAAFFAISVAMPAVAAEPGFIGLQVQGMSEPIAVALGLKRGDGAMVRDVGLGSPADKAGFQRGDLILEFNKKPVDTFEKLTVLASAMKAGDSAKVKVLRPKGAVTLTLQATAWPEGRKIDRGSFAAIDSLGITMAALTEKVRDRLGLRWGTTGVAVTLVRPDMEETLGLRRGELILQVNQREVWEPQQVADAYEQARKEKRPHVLMLVEGVRGFRFVLMPVL